MKLLIELSQEDLAVAVKHWAEDQGHCPVGEVQFLGDLAWADPTAYLEVANDNA